MSLSDTKRINNINIRSEMKFYRIMSVSLNYNLLLRISFLFMIQNVITNSCSSDKFQKQQQEI